SVDSPSPRCALMMKPGIPAVFGAGFALVVVALVLNALIAADNTRRLAANNRLVLHTAEVLRRLEGTLSVLKDAETGQRGYLITGEEGYLEPYRVATDQLDGDLRRLRALTADNPAQGARIDRLE